MAVEKFTINVSDALLTDLRRRLDSTRWPDELENVGWELGSSLSFMKSLAEYWRNGYDWRRQEAMLNELPQYQSYSMDSTSMLCMCAASIRNHCPSSSPMAGREAWSKW